MKLEIKSLNKKYHKKQALNNISVTLTDGIYGLLGPNGAGKSTLMNIITNNIAYDSGSIEFDGKDIFSMGRDFRKILGYMPQQQCLYESFTAQRFLSYVAALKGMKKDTAAKRIQMLLEMVNLVDVKDKRLREFSGGMKQRIMIAQAFLDDPKILILDEPTAGLDPKERIRIRNLISGLSKDKIVIIATHVVSDVEYISKNILLLKNGDLLYNQPPSELQTMLDNQVFEITVTEPQVRDVLNTYKVSNVYREKNQVIIRVVNKYPPENGLIFNSVLPTLEDVYLSIFDDGAFVQEAKS